MRKIVDIGEKSVEMIRQRPLKRSLTTKQEKKSLVENFPAQKTPELGLKD
jgi:hypothetical protein